MEAVGAKAPNAPPVQSEKINRLSETRMSCSDQRKRRERENSYQLLEMVHDELNWQRAESTPTNDRAKAVPRVWAEGGAAAAAAASRERNAKFTGRQ